jgi:uncharacterized C2H2 Zn-finger protein
MKKSRKKTILTCLDCGKIILGGSHMSRHVQKEHNYKSYDEYKMTHDLIKTELQLKNEGAISCGICGLLSHDLTSHVLRVHKLDIKQYKNQYGEIRSERYLKNQSNNIKGIKNPAYNHNGKFSPLSENFIYYDEEYKTQIIEKISYSNKNNGNNNTTILYWIKRGYTEEQAMEEIRKRQSTFTLEKCIEKYGEVEGKNVWLERQEKWIDSCKQTRKNGFSKISQELFWKIYDEINNKQFIYFAELDQNKNKDETGCNNEYKLRLKDKIILPDFLDIQSKKIIEFDGTYWHGKHIIKNTNKFRDQDRDNLAVECGFKVFRVKEEEYRKNPTKILNECLQFLNG